MYQPMPDYLQIPQYQMPLAAQAWALWIFGALAVLTLLWAAWRSRVEGSITPLLYAIGGGITCVLEPILARMSDAAHAQVGQITAYEAWGLTIPWHAAISYTFYFGLAYILLIPPFRDRTYTARKIWLILVAIIVSAWLYEAPLIRIGFWHYYGDQPWQFFDLMPVWWTVASAAMLLVPTTLIARFDALLTGWRKLIVVLLAPMGSVAGAAAVCWPIWLALNSPASDLVQWLAATLSIGLSILTVWLIIPLIARPETE